MGTRGSPRGPGNRRNDWSQAIAGVVILAIGILSLLRPSAGWAFGQAHSSDAAPTVGIGGLVIGIFLLGLLASRVWFTAQLGREARSERNRRQRKH
jgi:uncharacterized membrane protein